MQIVIDMPEGTFESVKRYYEQNQECYALCAYVANGIPLPKGHGRLIDADAISLDDIGFFSVADYQKMVRKLTIDTQTIVEADKEKLCIL